MSGPGRAGVPPERVAGTPPDAAGSSAVRPGPVLLAVGYLLFAAAGAMTAAIEVLLVPTRLGQTYLPLAPVLAVLSNVALPTLSRGLTGTRMSALPPFLGWLAATLVLAGSRPEGDVLLPAGDTAYISYSLLGLGTLAGAVAVTRAGRPRIRPSGQARAGSGSGGAR